MNYLLENKNSRLGFFNNVYLPSYIPTKLAVGTSITDMKGYT
jgi:hypothetical protein